MKSDLTDLVAWSHFFLSEVLEHGDVALDLTAGGGRDTLFLARQVGSTGRVFSFDIQTEAMARTSRLLTEEKIQFFSYDGDDSVSLSKGVFLIHASHNQLNNFVSCQVKAAIANLGYLPGGDKNLTTVRESTLAALHQAAEVVSTGGRMVVVVYVGHPGGEEESIAVAKFFQALDERGWRVLKLEPWKRKKTPLLWVAEKC